jgi:hypothetical protein
LLALCEILHRAALKTFSSMAPWPTLSSVKELKATITTASKSSLVSLQHFVSVLAKTRLSHCVPRLVQSGTAIASGELVQSCLNLQQVPIVLLWAVLFKFCSLMRCACCLCPWLEVGVGTQARARGALHQFCAHQLISSSHLARITWL